MGVVFEDVRNGEGEVFPDEVKGGIADEDAQKNLAATPLVFGIDPDRRQRDSVRSGLQKAKNDGVGDQCKTAV